MGERVNEYQDLYSELSGYERKGVNIYINEMSASPMQVVNAYMMREEKTYMRDYVMNEKGDIQKLCFIEMNLGKKAKF